MRGVFLRSYAGLAGIAVVAAFATHALIGWRMRAVFEERAAEIMEVRISLLRERAERGAPLLVDPGEAHPPPPRRRHARPGDPHDRGPRGEVVGVDAIPLTAEHRRALSDGGVVTVGSGEARAFVGMIDDARVFVVPAGGRGVPRALVLHQAVTLAVLLLVIGVGLWRLQRPIEARLARLAATARQLGEGDRSARSGVGGVDAVGDVGVQLDAMADAISRLLERREELLRSVSHELRTPLARLALLHEEATDAADVTAKDAALVRMRRAVAEITALVEDLLAFARIDGGPEVAGGVVAVGRLVARAVEDVDAGSLRVSFADSEAGRARGEERLVLQAVGNLIRNAVRHARAQVDVAVWGDGSTVVVDVDDDGPGIGAGDRDRVFEPFVRLEAAAGTEGAGLGLAIAKRAIERCGGTLSVETSPSGGARFRVVLPRAPGSPEAPEPELAGAPRVPPNA